MNKFTAPFNLERFQAGEPALTLRGKKAYFKEFSTDLLTREPILLYRIEGETCTPQDSIPWATMHWKMLPRVDDGWVPHDYSPVCPIPWAKAGEYEVAYRGKPRVDAIELDWHLIGDYKLLPPIRQIPVEEIIREGLREARTHDDAPDHYCPTAALVKRSDNLLAYNRFRASPRGRAALAMIGKSTASTPPLGEAAMLRLFNDALDSFEAQIEEKRK